MKGAQSEPDSALLLIEHIHDCIKHVSTCIAHEIPPVKSSCNDALDMWYV